VVAALIAGLTIYKKWAPPAQQAPKTETGPTNSVPPFATKEPTTYEATRIITYSLTSPKSGVSEQPHVDRILLARDGEQRREEYEAGALGSIVFLENVNGRFIILPQQKLYADANQSNASEESELQVEAELMSPDFLLHESNLPTQYQKLGPETVAGRLATKYRVMSSASGSTASHEGLIWIDETLGMPIATQYTSTSENDSIHVSMELQNIRTTVDPQTFALPADYRKVDLSQIIDRIRARKANPAVQGDHK
jgi:hypothetical protein